jgi:hypothetical protein
MKTDRSNFIKHGFHLNRIGKNRTKEMIINQIGELLTKKKSEVISQGWLYNVEEISHSQGKDNTDPKFIDAQQIFDKDDIDDIVTENMNWSDCNCYQSDEVIKNIIDANGSRKRNKEINLAHVRKSEYNNRRIRRPPNRNEEFLWV